MLPGVGGVIAALGLLSSCSRAPANRVQGYVEGEFVYVASPLSGTLQSLSVERGTPVTAGAALFALEHASEMAARDEAERRLAQARSNLEDAKKGKRPSEIESIVAQLEQARAALVLSEKEFSRQEQLFRTGATSAQDADRARSTNEQNRQRVAQLEAELKTAQLGARADQIAAAEASVRALEAALTKAEWNLSQKRQSAPEAGLVFETLYREGEWVAAGRPVVALLPPRNVKVRAFLPETKIGVVHHGDPVRVRVDGVSEAFPGKVSFISPKAEYTPPVIYSQENRRKLVFMIEVSFDPKTAANLHPGQPVDVEWGKP
ncbi:MAG: HlyD family efflux transporter periplasmic adaptor subunit [Verrucomicrobia bacterium]|nr:HlyD family efflux transporter periplasmic adaptor subunit [Verrucomicrobiota bacterium]